VSVSLLVAFSHRYEIDGDCWRWTGATNGKGYGTIRLPGGPVAYAHRVAYHLLVDDQFPIKSGGQAIQLDHVRGRCAVGRACVNPAHLEPVSNRLNTQRSKFNGRNIIGVVPHPQNIGVWVAQIHSGGALIYLGVRRSPEAAGRLYDAACIELGEMPFNYAEGVLVAPPSDGDLVEARGRLQRAAVARLSAA
jgi:hypothetical protein